MNFYGYIVYDQDGFIKHNYILRLKSQAEKLKRKGDSISRFEIKEPK